MTEDDDERQTFDIMIYNVNEWLINLCKMSINITLSRWTHTGHFVKTSQLNYQVEKWIKY